MPKTTDAGSTANNLREKVIPLHEISSTLIGAKRFTSVVELGTSQVKALKMLKDIVNVDMSKANDRIFLLKVPKNIAEKWSKCASNTEVGTLCVRTMPGMQKQQATLSLADAVVNMDPEEKIPKVHILEATDVGEQKLCVLSRSVASAEEKFALEGQIVQKLECRPTEDTSYMEMNLDPVMKIAAPTRQLQPLKKAVQNFKPINDQAHNMECRKKKKAARNLTRGDKNRVMDMLFSAFEKNQYYKFKDLVNITKQPVGYLKEILREVCEYNTKNPHKNMWELKKENRHYKIAEKEDKKTSSD